MWLRRQQGKGLSHFTMATAALNMGLGAAPATYKSLGPPQVKAGLSQWLYSSEIVPDQELISAQNWLSLCSSYSGAPGKLLLPCLACENKI